jgi:hypothetical protein
MFIVTFIRQLLFISLLMGLSINATAQNLPVPERPEDAPTGSDFKEKVKSMSLEDRESEIFQEVINGNVPDFLRALSPITFTQNVGDSVYDVTYYVIPDYVAIGSDEDYFLIPMTPVLAQKICNELGFTLPTKKMTDQIWSEASVKMAPSPIPPSDEMTTIPVMWQHNETVRGQRAEYLDDYPLGSLVAGHKKDVIISKRIYTNPLPKRVVIYGWHYQNGNPIQPVYAGHHNQYADYSHGIRLVQDSVLVNNDKKTITGLLQNTTLSALFSDEGVIQRPFYPLEDQAMLDAPDTFGVFSENSFTAEIHVEENTDATHYIIAESEDGQLFNSTEVPQQEVITLDGMTSDEPVYVKIKGKNASDESIYSEVLGAIPSEKVNETLVINGFDRGTNGNTYDFIRQHGMALHENGYTFNSATNEAVISGMVSLEEYKNVIWMLGEESTADETFSEIEQELVAAFLKKGGNLMVSGSEIAWDLDYRGSASDKQFFRSFLKSEYRFDAPKNQSGTWYEATGTENTLFSGLSEITFDDGTNGTYNVKYPDVLTPVDGGEAAMVYADVNGEQVAAVQFEGMFPDGGQAGKLVYLGFPLETIYPASTRKVIISRVMEFFESVNTTAEDFDGEMPGSIKLSQNYPNPFNPTTKIEFSLPQSYQVNLSVYNMLGQRVATLVNNVKSAGTHSVEWQAGTLSSGMYIYRLSTSDADITKKMLLAK